MQDCHELKRNTGIGGKVGRVKEEEIHACVHEQLHVLAHDVFIVDIVVAVKRLAPPVPGVNGTPQGIVHVACLVTRSINDLLHVLDTGVAVLTVPEEVEDTNVVILGDCAHLGGVEQRTVKIVRACVAAEQIDLIVGNGIGNGVFARAVGDGSV